MRLWPRGVPCLDHPWRKDEGLGAEVEGYACRAGRCCYEPDDSAFLAVDIEHILAASLVLSQLSKTYCCGGEGNRRHSRESSEVTRQLSRDSTRSSRTPTKLKGLCTILGWVLADR